MMALSQALATENTKPFLCMIFGFVSIEGVGGSRAGWGTVTLRGGPGREKEEEEEFIRIREPRRLCVV